MKPRLAVHSGLLERVLARGSQRLKPASVRHRSQCLVVPLTGGTLSTGSWQGGSGSRRFFSSEVSDASKFPSSTFVGRCSCGAAGFEASGPSLINFVCHCSICRSVGGDGKPVAACGFSPDSVKWHGGASIVDSVPEGSKNVRKHCGSCGSYLGEDASGPLGILALPHAAARTAGTQLDCPAYAAQHHIFYGSRIADVHDNLPKWTTLPSGGISGDRHAQGASKAYASKDVLPLSPMRPAYPSRYTFTEVDPPASSHTTEVTEDKVIERVGRKYASSPSEACGQAKSSEYDAIIIGGGHNGLITAAYLAKAGLSTLVLERRDLVGGAAVTEEIIPGFKFSRFSYLAGLLRPSVIQELDLHRHGLEYLIRRPSSFTPSPVDGDGRYLVLGAGEEEDHASIAQFSKQDADAYTAYEDFLGQCRDIVDPLLEGPPPNPFEPGASLRERLDSTRRALQMARAAIRHRSAIVPFYELLTGPAQQFLDRWFESEVLKTTLATDAVIGSIVSVRQNGSAYVLLHHVMGEVAGRKGVWSYARGGMGAVSDAAASAAKEAGAEVVTSANVAAIMYEDGRATGVRMADGRHLTARRAVVSNATPYHTFMELLPGYDATGPARQLPGNPLPRDFAMHVRHTDYAGGSFKINLALSGLPNFACWPSPPDGSPGPQHFGTIHFENRMQELEDGYREASLGMPATRPVVEMTIPSSLDDTLAPPGRHVCQLFVQFAPYHVDPKIGSWDDPAFTEEFVQRVYDVVERFAPGFKDLIIGQDVITPLDLERIVGLHQGNICHSALSLNQLAFARPVPGWSSHRTPLERLYLCGAGCHPGGGVMGAAGRSCARAILWRG
mmetsp:Transcript_79622/g.234158  ORF Transcript_79622/g.234158 Transcript_79622/m.234158 type:complete len:841 (+) Transcript_79622:58-2580(+)